MARPPVPKYTTFWDVDKVLGFFRAWPRNEFLSLRQLSAKLTLLLCLVSFRRVADVRAFDVDGFSILPEGVSFSLSRRTKTDSSSVFYPFFREVPKLCVVEALLQSLHDYLETPPILRWDPYLKPVSSCPTSIRDLLKLSEADPFDLLFDLGFGVDEPDICTKIPSRFIMSPSEARGINICVFLEAQKKRMDIENPSLCGRFRQLEVLEQVTNAFSSLLHDVNTSQTSGTAKEVTAGKKSTLTKEKRKRICQLLRKFSKKTKVLDQNSGPAPTKTETCVNQHDQNETTKDNSGTMFFQKTRMCFPEHGSLDVLTDENTPGGNIKDAICQKQESLQSVTQVSSVHAHVKQYILSTDMPCKSRIFRRPRVMSKTIKKTPVPNRLQPPDSFELEEVQSFEEEYPRVISHDSISEMSRTNSFQSDSSGFQEEPPEPLPLKNHKKLSLSLDSNDSHGTLIEQKHSFAYHTYFKEESVDENYTASTEEYESMSSDSIFQTCNRKPKLSMNIENNDDIFQSFESHTDCLDKHHELDQQETELKKNKAGSESHFEDHYEAAYTQECELDKQIEYEEENTKVDSSEVVFPVYITHYISKTEGSNNDGSCILHEKHSQDSHIGCMNELQDNSYSAENQFTDEYDESSVELYEKQWTPQPLSDFLSSRSICSTDGVEYYSDEEEYGVNNDKKNRFQTELNTNIYKSVTIQMSSDLQNKHVSEHLNKQHIFFTAKAERNEDINQLNFSAEKREAYSQTDLGWMSQYCTNSHCTIHRCCLTESLSFDTGLSHHHCHYHQTMRNTCIHCCHCCHHHHCCIPKLPSIYYSGLLRSNMAQSSMERDMTDTLKLLKESLTNISVNTDYDIENMKQACQRFRDKLIEIEQLINEQQAGCLSAFSSEERDEVRRMHLLRQNVQRELSELEFHLAERARHVKEITISKQLEQILDEQSKLYSELDLSNWEKELNPFGQYVGASTTSSFTSSVDDYKNITQEDPRPLTLQDVTEKKEQPQSQKMDFSTILQNIKKTFRNFNNS
ncbi:protein ITPRID1 [Rhinophrynus dorsalis]